MFSKLDGYVCVTFVTQYHENSTFPRILKLMKLINIYILHLTLCIFEVWETTCFPSLILDTLERAHPVRTEALLSHA